MAVFAVEIRKRARYKGQPEEWANVYHYETNPGELFDDFGVMDELVDAEEGVHNADVTIVAGRTWGPTDGPAFDNVIREDKEYYRQGSLPTSTYVHRAGVVLVSWQLPRSETTNRRRWLRKYIHCGGLPAGAPGAVATGAEPLPPAIKGLFETYASAVEDLSGALSSNYVLCTAAGAQKVAGTGKVGDFVTIHDLNY